MPVEILHPDHVRARGYTVVDVRRDDEIAADPVPDVLHIEFSTLPQRFEELPRDGKLAFLCTGNVRSMKAAEMLRALGYKNVCVYDKLA